MLASSVSSIYPSALAWGDREGDIFHAGGVLIWFSKYASKCVHAYQADFAYLFALHLLLRNLGQAGGCPGSDLSIILGSGWTA